MSVLSLNKLVFDTTATADSANVGAYLRSADGTLLTHTDVGGKKALDVRLAEGVNVEVDLSHVDDSVKIGDGTDLLAVNNDGSINSVVTATDLDIRDLAFATDKVDVTGSEVSLDATTLAALENITVSATDLDIRNLSHTQDTIKLGDGTDFLAINTDGSINAKTSGAITSAYAATSVSSTATDIIGTELTGRLQVMIQNIGNKDVYIGTDNSVTTSNGILLSVGATMVLDAGAAIDLFGITVSGTSSVRYLELGA